MKSWMKWGVGAVLTTVMMAGSAHATNDLVIRLMGNPKIDQNMVSYQCENRDIDGVPEGTFEVNYLQGGDNVIAVLPIKDQNRIFSAVMAPSGQKYMSGRFTWWRQNEKAALLLVSTEDRGNVSMRCRVVKTNNK